MSTFRRRQILRRCLFPIVWAGYLGTFTAVAWRTGNRLAREHLTHYFWAGDQL